MSLNLSINFTESWPYFSSFLSFEIPNDRNISSIVIIVIVIIIIIIIIIIRDIYIGKASSVPRGTVINMGPVSN